MKIIIIGTGYVGLVTGVCLSSLGHQVYCIDSNEEKINTLNNGVNPIYEPGLSELMQKYKNNITFTTDLSKYINEVDAIFCAVGTPEDENGDANMTYVYSVAEEVGSLLNKHIVFIDKSTVPVGTADIVKYIILDNLQNRGIDIDIDVVSNPEFLREGSAIDDFLYGDRIVVGADNERAFQTMRNIYKDLIDNGVSYFEMNTRSAEMTKYASNAMLATRISFINEIANLCDEYKANIKDVSKAMGADHRIGRYFLEAGCGYGGSCFPKDVQALYHMGDKAQLNMSILKSVHNSNLQQKHTPAIKVKQYCEKVLNRYTNELTFAILGCTFKSNTDDVRESPAITVVKHLAASGCKINIVDPKGMDNFKKAIGDKSNIFYFDNKNQAIQDADIIILLTNWDEFLDIQFWKNLPSNIKMVMDSRNVLNKDFVSCDLLQIGVN